ncbi:MAG: hypothetical protein ACPGUX_09610 [Halocynthiibacter sp.]
MKYLFALPFAFAVSAASSSPLTGDDFHITCISDRDGSEVVLTRSGGVDKGYIHTANINGDATIFPGVGSLTFMHIEGNDVMTFVVHFDTHDYDLSVQGPHAGNDHGVCGDPVED